MVLGAAAGSIRIVTKPAPELTLLNKQLASEKQVADLMAGRGKVIAGAGSKRAIDDVGRLVSEYGGNKNEWAKISSETYKAADGSVVETHAYRNVATGVTVEPKSKLP
jgi:hypothetical protein